MMYKTSRVHDQKAHSKNTKGGISSNSIDLLHLPLIKVHRSPDLANFVSMMTMTMTVAMTIELIALPLVHARRVVSVSDMQIVMLHA